MFTRNQVVQSFGHLECRISTNPPMISGIWSLAPSWTIVRLRLQSTPTISYCPTKKEGQKMCSKGQNRDSQGHDRDNLEQNRDKQGQNRDSQGQNRDMGIIRQTPHFVLKTLSHSWQVFASNVYFKCQISLDVFDLNNS